MPTETDAVGDALRRIVRDHGRRVVEHPIRVRALLADALGASARDLRAEVDAVVVAAEEGVGTAFADGVEGDDAADDQRRAVEDRGLSAAMAALAVEAWRSALTENGSDSTAGASATATAHASGSGSDPGAGGLAKGGPRSAEQVEATELPMPGGPGVASPGRVDAGTARGDGADRPPLAPDAATTSAVGTAYPRALTLHRGWTVAAGATSLAVAFSLGLLGSGPLGINDRSATLTAADTTPTPTSTPSTSVVTVRTVETKSVTTSVTKTVTVNPAQLKANGQSWTITPTVAWAGTKKCAPKGPTKATQVWPCYQNFFITATGSLKSWKIVSARVSGKGTTKFSGKQLDYYFHGNGAYTATLTFVIASGSVQSTGTVKLRIACNPNFACGRPLPS